MYVVPTSPLAAAERARVSSLLAGEPWFDFYWRCSLDDLRLGLDNRAYRIGGEGRGLVMAVHFERISIFSTVGDLAEADVACTADGASRAEVHAAEAHAAWARARAGARLETMDRILYYRLDHPRAATTSPGDVECRRIEPRDHDAVRAFYAAHYSHTVLSPWMLELPFVGVWVGGELAAGAGTIVLNRALRACHVGHFLTHPHRRGLGLAAVAGSRLFEELAREGVTTFFLGVSESNRAASRAYERMGFALVEGRPLLHLAARPPHAAPAPG